MHRKTRIATTATTIGAVMATTKTHSVIISQQKYHHFSPTKPGESILHTVEHGPFYHIAQLILGFIALPVSGYVLSHSAASIADAFDLSGTVLGVTVLSFATTLPEKFVAVISG